MSNAKTKACTTATIIPCIYTIIGRNNGRLNPIKLTVNHQIHRNATFNNIPHEDILPNSLIDNETTFASIPMISRNEMNNEIAISPILFKIPLPSINPLPNIGKYSCKKSFRQSLFRCTYRVITTPTKAKAILNSISAVTEVTFLNRQGKINLIISFIIPNKFAISMIKNNDTT